MLKFDMIVFARSLLSIPMPLLLLLFLSMLKSADISHGGGNGSGVRRVCAHTVVAAWLIPQLGKAVWHRD